MTTWKYEIRLADVFTDYAIPFQERRDIIVKRIRNSDWFRSKDELDDLPAIVEELEATFDEDEFDLVWNGIYDEADADRVWIGTF